MKHFKQGFNKAGLIAALVAVAFIVVAAVLVIDANNRKPNFNSYNVYSVLAGDGYSGNIGDHVKGNPAAPVLIFEFADFQCPGCSSMNPFVNQAVAEMEEDLAIVYRNYLLSYHQNATAAATAAEAAGLQGYWHQMGDILFHNQSDWEYASASERTELFVQYFEEASNGAGDVEQFKSDLKNSNISKKIQFDQELGVFMGVSGTPAFFVDGQLIDWSNSKGGSIEVNGQTIAWDHKLSATEFVQLLRDIVNAKTGKNYQAPQD